MENLYFVRNGRSGTRILHRTLKMSRSWPYQWTYYFRKQLNCNYHYLSQHKWKYAGFNKSLIMRSRLIMCASCAEHEQLITAVRSQLFMTFRHSTYSEPWSGFLLTFLKKRKNCCKKILNQFLTVCKAIIINHNKGNDSSKKAKFIDWAGKAS
jgi:hypothetical protein